MSDARLEPAGAHRWAIRGALDFHTVPRLWRQLVGRIDASDWVLDMSGVDQANSAGLALLLEARAETERHGGSMRVEGLPASLSQLGAMSGLGSLLDELRG